MVVIICVPDLEMLRTVAAAQGRDAVPQCVSGLPALARLGADVGMAGFVDLRTSILRRGFAATTTGLIATSAMPACAGSEAASAISLRCSSTT